MIKRSLHICMRTVLGLIALCVILTGFAAWRLSQGPVKLDFLTPYLADSLAAGLHEKASVKIGETVLIWADWSRAIDVRLRDVKLINDGGLPLISLPELSVNISFLGLLFGQVVPSKVEAFGASITLVRRKEGGFDFESYGLEGPDTTNPTRPDTDVSLVLPKLLKELTSAPRRDDPLSFLKTLRIVDGSLFVIDRSMDSVWHAPSATISVQRVRDGLAARAKLSFDDRDGTGDLELSLFYRSAEQAIELEAKLADLYPPSLGVFGSDLASVAGLNLPLRGKINASLQANGRLRSLTYDISALPGSLTLPELLPQSVAVHDLALRGGWDSEAATLRVDEAALSFSRGGLGGGAAEAPELNFKGLGRFFEAGLRLDFESRVVRVPADDLAFYWPTQVAEHAREWVTENIRKGIAEEAQVSARLWVPAEDPGAMVMESLSGMYRYSDLELHYRKPLPPITGVSGTATFDQARMDFQPESGRVGTLTIDSSVVEITGLDEEDQYIDIKFGVHGPLREALTLLNHESLGLISDLGVDPGQTAGAAKAAVHFAFPLIRDLTFDSVQVDAQGKVDNLRLEAAALDKDVSDGFVELEIQNDGMTVTGPVVFGGIPIQLRWDENFGAAASVQSAFFIEFERLNQSELQSLGLDFGDFLDGRLKGWLEIQLDSERSGKMDLSVDLASTRLTLSHLNWVKPLNVPGRLKASLGLTRERFVDLEIKELTAGTLSGHGHGRFDDAGDALEKLELKEVRLDKNRLDSVTFEWEERGTRIFLGDGELDAEPFLADVAEEGDDGPADKGLASPDILISAPHLNSVHFGDGREVQDVAFLMERRNGGWRRLSIKGRVPEALWTEMPEQDQEQEQEAQEDGASTTRNTKLDEGTVDTEAIGDSDAREAAEMGPNKEERSFSLDYGPEQDGLYPLTVKADDVGGLLRAFNLNDTVKGGRLSIKGGSPGPIPMHSLQGKIRVRDFVLVDTPVLARMLSVASFTGLSDTLSGNGIRFDRLKGEFSLTNGVAHTKLLRAYGPGLGITSQGSIDFDQATIDLEGTIVPAYSVNQVLEKIPLVGILLTGGEGEGLFAVLYGAEGPLTDPNVTVNPLSLLTPGFLRSIFGRPGGDAPTAFPSGPDK